jgi:hypothetical protein
MEAIGKHGKWISEEWALACATGLTAGLVNQILCLDVCVKGHQESNLKPRSEDRSFANAPIKARLLLLYTATLFCPTADLLLLNDQRLPVL